MERKASSMTLLTFSSPLLGDKQLLLSGYGVAQQQHWGSGPPASLVKVLPLKAFKDRFYDKRTTPVS